MGQARLSGDTAFDEAGVEHEVLTLGPVSVLPEYQGKGAGKALLQHSISEARRLGYGAIVFYGHPDYYPRVGFRRAKEFGITTASGKNIDALMAMPLYDGAFQGISGRFHEDPVCQIDPEEAAEFDKSFPPKGKRVLEPIDILVEKLAPPAQEAIRERGIKYLTTLTRFSGVEIASWPGIDEAAKATINDVLVKHGYPTKVFNPPKEWCV